MTAETPPPLTGEELERLRGRLTPITYFTGRRLIAELSSARDALARMTAERDHWQRMYDVAKARADKAEGLPSPAEILAKLRGPLGSER